MKNLKHIARAYALKNAISYNGKANQGSVISGLFNEGLKKSEVGKYIKDVSEVIKEINSLSIDQQKKEFEKLNELVSERESREGLPELENTKKGVIMRISPSPSGGLHIGNAMTFCLNFVYVQKYGGTFYVRIEDTNPENIYKSAYKMIEQESKWLSDKKAKIVIQSDRIPLYYKYAEKLLKNGNAYVCSCSGDEFREFAKRKKACPCRKLDIKENFKRWKKMLDKNGFKEGEAVLRFKSSMLDPNPAMRDFPLARINITPHPLQKKKYRVWPLMNLAVTTDDIEMKMTHIIRGKDHRDNSKRQELMYKALGKKMPKVYFNGRMKFNDLELSKTKIRQAIQQGKFKGWDDKRLPTLASLKKQGYKPEAFWKLADHMGISEVDKVMEKKDYFELLDTFSK